MRYLDIINYFEQKKASKKKFSNWENAVPSLHPGQKDEINEKSPYSLSHGTWIQWTNRDGKKSVGQILLAPRKGWMVLQEYIPGERMVFVHTKSGIKVLDPRSLNMPGKGGKRHGVQT